MQRRASASALARIPHNSMTVPVAILMAKNALHQAALHRYCNPKQLLHVQEMVRGEGLGVCEVGDG